MSAAKVCPQCNNEYPLDQRFCPLDGSTLKTMGGANDLVGSVVADRYYVLRKLGEGGMGQVYLAEHVRMGRKSALKVMHPSMVQDADAISRFNREAANASRISHPNVAAIYDFGETGDGLIYLAMEFVEGEPLTAIVERTGALPPARAAAIIEQTGSALATAHDMGIVHRDLKPDNIMITKDREGNDLVKVVDFGIAKSNEGSQKVTKTGLVVGTPEYMSPEQLAGDKLDGRSDIYSLGLVAFNLLTGKLPFPSESAQESMIMRLTDRPKQLGEMATHVQWPAELQAVMDKALERDAKLRYASAKQFGQDFAKAIEAMPETAAAAAGTMVLDPGTLVVPKTVVSGGAATQAVNAAPVPAPAPAPAASAAPAAAAAAPAKSRMPIFAGAAAVLVVAAAAGVVLFNGGTGVANADSLAAAVPQVAANGATAQDSGGATGGVEQLAQPQPAGTEVPATKTSTPSNVPAPRPNTPAAPSEAQITADLSRVEKIVETLEASESEARNALAVVRRLDPYLVTRPHLLQAGIIKAYAYTTLGNTSQGCQALRDIESIAPGSKYATFVSTTLSASCE